MASTTSTKDMGIKEMKDFRTKLKAAKKENDDGQKTCDFIMAICAVFAITGAGIISLAGIQATLTLKEMSDIHDMCDTAIDYLSDYISYLYENDNYNLVRFELKSNSKAWLNGAYIVPESINAIGVHQINPPGWNL